MPTFPRSATLAAFATLALAVSDASAQSLNETRAYREGFNDGRRDALVRGNYVPRDLYRLLGPEAYYRDYGRRLERGLWYAAANDGSRVLIDASSGVLVRVLSGNNRAARPRHGRAGHHVPPGAMPPPGLCRLWYPNRPVGHQPPPGRCNVFVPRGALLIRG
ncbi:hypothetical protein [Roseovarius sp.]|uniref:hypothetical protein n=1 Tax=Roseovarius sp. TaxID=1486281 RepID=UPI0026143A78|nr:hypothetical protein [Roseovarius sp.]MDM8166209.1 hypothetical protein [Roseovarius sp.]